MNHVVGAISLAMCTVPSHANWSESFQFGHNGYKSRVEVGAHGVGTINESPSERWGRC